MTKIKTQRVLSGMPEPVGSPAVLYYRVSNPPLRVVRSLSITFLRRERYGQDEGYADGVFR